MVQIVIKKDIDSIRRKRAIALSMLNIADEIVLLKDNELSKAIEILKPNMLILGKEFENVKDEEVITFNKILYFTFSITITLFIY